ncbi:MAG: FxsA family protein [Corynebacteriales bacterium]|nr:FxsA family protein [Mycobacteriales bacterium]
MRVFAVIVVLFLVGAILDLALLVYIASQTSAVVVALWILGAALLGSWLMKRQGRRAWRAVREAVNAGQLPAKEAIAALLIYVGGLALMFPGPLSDVVGLLLMVPLVRRAAAGGVAWMFMRRVPMPMPPSGHTIRVDSDRDPTARPAPGKVIEGTVAEPDR